jgi:hypothetical protein
MDALNDHEASRLMMIRAAWLRARAAKEFSRADRLRKYLANAGLFGEDLLSWIPVFEAPEHRSRRLKARGDDQ